MNHAFQYISEKDLDVLLNRAFLDLDFDSARNQDILNSISDKVMSSTTASLPGISGSKLLMLSTIPFAAIVGMAVVMISGRQQKNGEPIKREQVVATRQVTSNTLPLQQDRSDESVQRPPVTGKKPIVSFTNKEHEATLTTNQFTVKESSPAPLIDYAISSPTNTEEDGYIFPTLTEKEKKDNEKEKKKMAKLAGRLNKQYYSAIKSSSGQGKLYMRTCEITNLEYRTFLFDLLMQGRKDEFLKAKPVQDLWVNAAGINSFDYLSKVYFSEKKYNDFPVVNISGEGAEMYCRWLNDIVASLGTRDEDFTSLEFRLPEDREWLNAASVGRSDAVYPWFTDSIQNKHNLFLANFCYQKLQDKFKQPIIYPKKYKVNDNAYTSAGYVLGDTGAATILVYCYNPNDNLLYAVCGNASEMVYVNGSKDIKTRGGNWASDFEHLKFNSEDEFPVNPKPSPMIGFRVCAFVK